MIYLTKGQTLFDNQTLVVCDTTGYYDDGASVLCAASYNPDEPVCRYEAKFIAYGNTVYNITDPDQLMKQILEIDPKSLFGKNNQDVALDKAVENIQTVNSTDTPTTEQTNPITTPEQLDNALSTSTPVTPDDIPSIVDTPPTDIPIEIVPVSTSTTPIDTSVIENISTTTPLTDITF